MSKMKRVTVSAAITAALSALAFVIGMLTGPDRVQFQSEKAWAIASSRHMETVSAVVLLLGLTALGLLLFAGVKTNWRGTIASPCGITTCVCLLPGAFLLVLRTAVMIINII